MNKQTFQARVKVPVGGVTAFEGSSMTDLKCIHDHTEYREIDVVVVVDVQAIAEKLAYKAYNSKGRRATMVNGAVAVKPITP